VSAYNEEVDTATDMLRIAHRLSDTREQETAFYLTSAIVHSNLAVSEAIREGLTSSAFTALMPATSSRAAQETETPQQAQAALAKLRRDAENYRTKLREQEQAKAQQ